MSHAHSDQGFDYSESLKAKSDQLNADDLIGGPITVRIVRSTRGNKEQPVVLHLEGGHQPWKPCKTMLRLLAAATGSTSTSAIVGRWVTLYRDPTVKWAGKEEGGVRLSHMSGLDRPVKTRLQVSRGKKDTFTVLPLKVEDQHNAGAPTAKLADVLADNDLTVDDFDQWRATQNKPLADGLTDEQRAHIAVWLVNNQSAFNDIRAAIAPEPPVTDGAEE